MFCHHWARLQVNMMKYASLLTNNYVIFNILYLFYGILKRLYTSWYLICCNKSRFSVISLMFLFVSVFTIKENIECMITLLTIFTFPSVFISDNTTNQVCTIQSKKSIDVLLRCQRGWNF